MSDKVAMPAAASLLYQRASLIVTQRLLLRLESTHEMTLVTSIRHFLDEKCDIPELPWEAQELLSFLGKVVEAASLDNDQAMTLAGEICLAVVGGKKCKGEI